MSRDPDTVLKLHFRGRVYDSQTLDGPALQEIVKIIDAVRETARSLWRRRNPDRQRVPNGFDQTVELGLREIGAGSAITTLVRTAPPSQPPLMDAPLDPLAGAVDFMHGVFKAARRGDAPPEALDDHLCGIYARLGANLPPNSTLQLSLNGETGALIDETARQWFRDHTPDTITDIVDISGRVLAADIRRQKFALWLDSTTHVEAAFGDEQERQITEALHNHESVRMRLRGHGRFQRNGELIRIDQVDQVDTLGTERRTFDQTAPSVSEMVAAAFAHVSDESWDSLPTNFAERHDDYLSLETSRD